MKIIADFHTHSRFAMACSQNITLQGMETAAIEKGINLISTGDFLHTAWLPEMASNLEEHESTGLFKVKGSKTGVRFILSGEVCTIFPAKDRTMKKVHQCIALPSFESVSALQDALKKYGSLGSDGRPILSMSAADLVETVFRIDQNAFVFPAHAWTPYFGVLGSISGFDSIKDAYEDQEKHIFALETGLSSDPLMNWCVSELDKYTLLSNSDMHSLPKMGREANVFELDEGFDYKTIINAIKDRDSRRFKGTLEFYPEEGKYHYDGHRNCNFSTDPGSGISVCPVCGKKLVVGVLHRVFDLADRKLGFRPDDAPSFTYMVPLREILAYAMKKNVYSPVIESQYAKLVEAFGTEFKVLMDTGIEEIAEQSNEDVAQSVKNVRENRIHIKPGYAGVFGELDLLGRDKKTEKKARGQSMLKASFQQA
jgi:uncharacterized protein (TIGR00375 family)